MIPHAKVTKQRIEDRVREDAEGEYKRLRKCAALCISRATKHSCTLQYMASPLRDAAISRVTQELVLLGYAVANRVDSKDAAVKCIVISWHHQMTDVPDDTVD